MSDKGHLTQHHNTDHDRYRHNAGARHHHRLQVEVEAPWFHEFALSPHYDLVHLRPPTYDNKGRNRGFETPEQCAYRDELNIKVLRKGKDRAQELADELENCTPEMPCGSCACKKCMRAFRRAQTGLALPQCRDLAVSGLIPVLLTLVFTTDKLRSPTLPKTLCGLHQRVRMIIRRVHLDHVPMIGGVEVDWNEAGEVWDLHYHLVCFVGHIDEFEPIRERFRKANGVSRPMQVKEVNSLPRSLAYCWKFSPMRKVKYRRDGKTHTRKMRLRDPQLRSALVWLHRNRPEHFVFMQGMKRNGSKLVIL